MIIGTKLMSASHAGQVKGNDPHKKGYPAPPRRSWTWCWQLHLIKCSNGDKLLTAEVGSSSSSSRGQVSKKNVWSVVVVLVEEEEEKEEVEVEEEEEERRRKAFT